MEFIVPEWITPSWKSVSQQKDFGTVGLRQSNINSWSETVVEMWSLEKEPRAGIENCLCVLTWHRRALRMARGTEDTPYGKFLKLPSLFIK